MLAGRGRGDAAPPGPARAQATSALLAGASPVACGQCELQGVGRQVWLCLTGVGSRRNLAQRGPEWLGERDLRVCRSPQPFLAAHAPHRRTSGPRPRLSPRRYVFPRARLLLFCRGYGSLAYQGQEKHVGGLLGSGSCSGAQGRVCARGQRRMRERPRADACAEQRRAHPPNSTVCVR